MALTNSDWINIAGIMASVMLSIFNLVVAIIVFRYAKGKDDIKGPIFSVFDINLLNSQKTTEQRYGYKDGEKLFINLNHTLVNDGDRPTSFIYEIIITLDVIIDGEPIYDRQNVYHGENSNIFKPGEYSSPVTTTFYFEDIRAENWGLATLRFLGYYYDHNRRKIPIERTFSIWNSTKQGISEGAIPVVFRKRK